MIIAVMERGKKNETDESRLGMPEVWQVKSMVVVTDINDALNVNMLKKARNERWTEENY